MSTTNTRSRRGWIRRWFDSTAHDVRFALRSFGRRPAFTATAVATLALGIGATTSVVSIVDATLLKPLPFPGSDRVVNVWAVDAKQPQFSFGITRLQSEALRLADSFESVAEYASWVSQPYTVPRSDGPQVVNGVNVSPDFFKVFRVAPARGRIFTADDERVEKPEVCLITAAGVRRLFGGNRNVVGRTLSFVEGPLTVVGVMEEGFWYPLTTTTKAGQGESAPDLLVPFARRGPHEGPSSRNAVAARLRAGVTVARAERDAVTVARHLAKPNADGSLDGLRVRSLHEELASESRSTLLTLFGFAACLLLICCVNIANLLLSHSNGRTRELAVRTALGAGRLRLFRQLFTEHMVLALAGGLGGLYLTVATMDGFVRLLPKGLLIVPLIDLDARMLALAALVTVATGLLAGLGPALAITREGLAGAIKAGALPVGRTPRWRSLTSVLLVVEAAVLLVLLSGGGLLVHTLIRLKTIDLGFDADRLWMAEFMAPKTLYAEAAQVGQLGARAREAMAALPGVVAVGESDWGLLGGFCPGSSMAIEGRPDELRPQVRHVTSGYFAAVNMGLRSGQLWTAANENVTPEVALVNEAAARAYWPKEDPIGRRVIVNKKWAVRIVGVVRDLREANEREAPGPSVYLPLNPSSTRFYRARTLVVRTREALDGLGLDGVKAMAAIDPRLPVTVHRADDTLSERRQDPRFYAVVVGLAAVFALLLAAVGIGGVTAQGVSRRTREIGVRLALGANASGVVGLIVRQVCAPVAIGAGIGVVAALAVSRVLKSFLYEISPQDVASHAAAVALLIGVALAAAILAARRAASINPVDALRSE